MSRGHARSWPPDPYAHRVQTLIVRKSSEKLGGWVIFPTLSYRDDFLPLQVGIDVETQDKSLRQLTMLAHADTPFCICSQNVQTLIVGGPSEKGVCVLQVPTFMIGRPSFSGSLLQAQVDPDLEPEGKAMRLLRAIRSLPSRSYLLLSLKLSSS